MTNPTYTDEQVRSIAKEAWERHSCFVGEMIDSLLADRQRLQAEVEALRPKAELLAWAESHPEIAMREITSWWRVAGSGFRENWFNFSGAIESARATPNETKEAKS